MVNNMMGTGIKSLPEEILSDILIRLPIKFLMQCQCVCKAWEDLIKNPYFIAQHLNYYRHQNRLLLQRCISFRYDQMRLSLLNRNLEFNEVQNAPLIDFLPWVCIIGSTNGLLCLEIWANGISPESLLLWNPTIRKVKEVHRTINGFVGECFSGFGFSPMQNDYKIVRVCVPVYYQDGSLELYERIFVNRAEVYSLRRTLWREVGFENLEDVRFHSNAVTITGAVVWIGSRNHARLIISFDLEREVFELIPMPALHPGSGHLKLTEYENKLAILAPIVTLGNPDTTLIDLWVMEVGIWAHHNVGPHAYQLAPMTIWTDEIISYVQYGSDVGDIEGEGENNAQKYILSRSNVTIDEFIKFGTRRCGPPHSPSIFNYVESLVDPCGSLNYAKWLKYYAECLMSAAAPTLFCAHCIFALCQHFVWK